MMDRLDETLGHQGTKWCLFRRWIPVGVSEAVGRFILKELYPDGRPVQERPSPHGTARCILLPPFLCLSFV
ncbi:hypothetical protein E2C01_050238 [Portunus trituberculatus]|uniref:Uncharacterized protein n=1 Tax=Portunus trituberculatus TaxID=210409 RepID=A0A5B7GFX3_PORTR|nr:hypothetical protein [Portunus trituberculatus]